MSNGIERLRAAQNGNGIVKSYPTKYRNVQFRSRLEARWAAFFDLVNWPWEYEPLDLDGWIPDFRLLGKSPTLVEVKPIDFATFNDPAAAESYVCRVAPNVIHNRNRMLDEIDAPDVHIHHSFPQLLRHEILVLGTAPCLRLEQSGWGDARLGLLLLENWCNGTDWALLWDGYEPQKLDYAAEWGSYAYRIGGQYEGDSHLRGLDVGDLKYCWAEAGNRTQWKAPE